MFSDYGNVLSASIIFDRMSGRSKGFGFVEIEDDEEAQKAISEMNGKDMEGRNVVVSVARPKEERPQRNFS
jgi:RNA recognition motif-containing protein